MGGRGRGGGEREREEGGEEREGEGNDPPLLFGQIEPWIHCND